MRRAITCAALPSVFGLLLAMLATYAAPPAIAVDRCSASGATIPGEALSPGWERSYRSGCPDDAGKLAGGSEVLHLVPHKGKLYAGVGYWMDPRNPWYSGSPVTGSWAQVLRLDGPNARWQVDLDMAMHLRAEILYSATFTTDGSGRSLPSPVTLLFAAAYQGNGSGGVSLFTRDDASGRWEKSKIIDQPTGKKGEDNSVRALRVHRDKVTGVDRLFVSVGVFGIFSGIYDPAMLGKIRWDARSESGPVAMRPLAIIEANGALLFSSDRAVYRRVDGLQPRYEPVVQIDDAGGGSTFSPVGGIRGMTAIANPAGAGQSLLLVWAPGKQSRSCVLRFDPSASGAYTRADEICLDTLVRQYLSGTPAPYVLAGYNELLSVKDPVTNEIKNLIGMSEWVSGNRVRTTQSKTNNGGFYAGALYAVRDAAGRYRMHEVNGPINASNPELVATRTYTASPFPQDDGRVVYFGGYDCNYMPAPDTAWIFRTSLANALGEMSARAPH
jgi:hypothetical protein